VNTFHYDDSKQLQQLNSNFDYLGNLNLLSKEQLQSVSQNDMAYLIDLLDLLWHQQLLAKSMKAISLKLSVLQNLKISIRELLDISNLDFLIDAESQRLDRWLLTAISDGIIKTSDLNRLTITLQVRRADALSQLKNLDAYYENELRVLLVAGHMSYLNQDNVEILSTIEGFSRIGNHRLIKMIGCGAKLYHRLVAEEIITNTRQLELQGYQNGRNTALWVYYGGKTLSREAEQYLVRRNNSTNHFICRSAAELCQYGNRHNLYIFIDASKKKEFISKLVTFNHINNNLVESS